jgi:hypothetical protein
MANVAQAEFVGGGEWQTASGFTRSSAAIQSTFAAYTSGVAGTALGKATSAGTDTTVTFPFLPAGQYFVTTNMYNYMYLGGVAFANCEFSIEEIDGGTRSGYGSSGAFVTTNIYPPAASMQGNFNFTTGSQRRFRIVSKNTAANGAGSLCASGQDALAKTGIYVYRFPTSSELVVTPERQNTFAGVRLYSTSNTNAVTSGTITKLTTSTSATRTSYGKADTTATNDLSLTIKNLPVGSYKIEATGTMFARAPSAGTTAACIFSLSDSATAGSPLASMYQNAYGDASAATQDIIASSTSGIYVNTSVADRTFFVRAQRAGGTGSCLAYSDDQSPFNIIVTPLDQPSNSALYVQGPVLAAATGAAISSGYVFNNFYGSEYSGSYANGGWLSLTSTTLSPGLWQVEAACMMRNNTVSTTTNWNFAALSISNNSSDQGTDTNPHSYQYRQPSASVQGQYDFLNTKRIIYTTTTTLRYLNIYSSWLGGGTPTYNCQFFVMRLN